MIIDFLLLIIVLTILVAGAVYDKQRREIPSAFLVIVYIVAGLGLVYQLISSGLTYIVPSAIAVGLWFSLHIVNVILERKGHKRIIGGADLNIYLAVSLCIPVFCNLWTAVWLIPLTFLFCALWRLVPSTNKDCTERGTPLIYFMLIAFVFMLIMHCLLYGFTFI